MREWVFIALGIQTGPFAATGAPFVREIFLPFHLQTGELILITPQGQLSEKEVPSTPKLDETEGFQCLGHSNWTICSPLSHFCFQIFASFSPSYWAGIHYFPMVAWIWGEIIAFSSLLQAGERNFFTSYLRNQWEVINPCPVLGGQFLFPQRANYQKRKFIQPPKLDRTEGLRCLGYSN